MEASSEIISDFELESIISSLKESTLESVGVDPEWRLQANKTKSLSNSLK